MELRFTIGSDVLPLVFVGYVAVMAALWAMGRRYSVWQYAALTALAIYALVVAGFVLLPLYVNLPIHDNITSYFMYQRWRFGLNLVPLLHVHAPQFAMNVALFMPLGVLLPLLYIRMASLGRVARFGLMASVAIEVAQWLIQVVLGTGRSTDIDDVLANTLGAMLGYGVFWLATRLPPVRALVDRVRLPVG